MNNLKKGKITIEDLEISPETKLDELEMKIKQCNDIEIRQRTNGRSSVRFLNPVQLGSKKFIVRISFKNNDIFSVELVVSDPNIHPYDYEKKLSQHGDWLVEQLGHPDGILDDNFYPWGKINQWDDPRSGSAGIDIIYY